MVRGALKKVSQKVEKVQKGGGGVRKKIKKSKIRKLDFLIRGGGGYIFIFFPYVNIDFKCFSWTKNKLVLKWFLCNFKCFKLLFLFWGGGSQKSEISMFPIFPNCGLFPLFVNFFLFGGFPKMVLIAYTVTFWPISKTARLSQ